MFIEFLRSLKRSVKNTFHEIWNEWEAEFRRRDELRAQMKGLVIRCRICERLIFPGDFVAVQIVGGENIIVHAGLHQVYNVPEGLICAPISMKVGTWNGKGIDVLGKAVKTKSNPNLKVVCHRY